MSYCVKKAKERKFMIKREFDSFFSLFGILYVGISTCSTCILEMVKFLEKSCSIHGQLNRFSMDWNNELYTEFFWKFFWGQDVSFDVATEKLRSATVKFDCSIVVHLLIVDREGVLSKYLA